MSCPAQVPGRQECVPQCLCAITSREACEMKQPNVGEPGIFECKAGALELDYTLTNGQMFRWRKTPEGWWDAVVGKRMVRIRSIASSTRDTERFEFYTFPEGP